MTTLLSYPDALQRLKDNIQPLPIMQISWRDCLGSTLAENVYAREALPAFDNSAMDGFAVHTQDVCAASIQNPIRLKIAEEIFAGSPLSSNTVPRGYAVKIMTGAPLPPGADTVVMVENTRLEDDSVLVFSPAKMGEHIRRQGEEIQVGNRILSQGSPISPVELGLLASQGIQDVHVRPFPKVALFTSGDELIEPEEELSPGQIRNANTHTLNAEVERFGCPTLNMGIVPDDPASIRRQIEKGIAESNLLLTIGGVSAGEKDFIPSILRQMGVEIHFHKLNVKPGKPLLFGILDGVCIFGLPGNVVSVLTSYHLFVKPAIRLMMGRSDWQNPVSYARIAQKIHNNGTRTFFVRCQLSPTPTGLPLAIPTGHQGSGMLTSMLHADGLAIIPGDIDTVEEFDVVEYIPLRYN